MFNTLNYRSLSLDMLLLLDVNRQRGWHHFGCLQQCIKTGLVLEKNRTTGKQLRRLPVFTDSVTCLKTFESERKNGRWHVRKQDIFLPYSPMVGKMRQVDELNVYW